MYGFETNNLKSVCKDDIDSRIVCMPQNVICFNLMVNKRTALTYIYWLIDVVLVKCISYSVLYFSIYVQSFLVVKLCLLKSLQENRN